MTILSLIIPLLSLAGGLFAGKVFFSKVNKNLEADAQSKADEILKNASFAAENLKKDRMLEAKENFLRLRGEFEEDKRALMHAKVWRDGHCVFDALAMNDVVVNRGATSGMVEMRVEVDGRFVANQRADGLIIATSTGSTAYSLSAGGPLLHPSLNAWVMAPIAPHTLSNRPIVLADTEEIAIDLISGRDASANFDMQSLAALLLGDRITVTRSKFSVRFLHPKGWSYFDTLREKLHWNEGVA